MPVSAMAMDARRLEAIHRKLRELAERRVNGSLTLHMQNGVVLKMEVKTIEAVDEK